MSTSSAQAILKKYFGYDQFRPLQDSIIQTIYSGRDSVSILPTGGGKSLCFQIPGLLLAGTTVVVSPLISLMQDQVEQLQKKQIKAVMVTSIQNPEQKKASLELVAKGEAQFVYVSPEQLQTKSWQDSTKQTQIPLVVIDEAHCITQWGDDFRPAYRKISSWIQSRPQRPTIAAFTATATTQTKLDICRSLQLRDPQITIQNQLPDHLEVALYLSRDLNHKMVKLFQILSKHQSQAGIIYTATRKDAEQLAALLQTAQLQSQWGRVAFYHGVMEAKDRLQVQADFIANRITIITATNAFGMGVDKPDIRFVIHYQMPSSIEAFSQEIGRAGRDRLPASCYLLFLESDLTINKDLTKDNLVKKTLLKKMLTLTRSTRCVKTQLAEYFSLNGYQKSCNTCSNCKQIDFTSHHYRSRYQQLLNWRTNYGRKHHKSPSFLLSQYQAALLILLQPKDISDLKKIPSFGNGWIRQCLPLLPAGTISNEIQKENYDDPA